MLRGHFIMQTAKSLPHAMPEELQNMRIQHPVGSPQKENNKAVQLSIIMNYEFRIMNY